MTARRQNEIDDVSTALADVRSVPAGARVAFRVSAVEGPDRGATLDIDGSEPSRVLIGKSPACQLRLTDPQVSRRHIGLSVEGRRLRVVDLDSTNGSFVDGVSVRDGHLSGGELVRIGSTALRIDAWEPGEPAEISVATRFGRLVGASPAMRRLYPLCERLAASDVTVIVEGETGTGKEVLAESLHEQGARAAFPFVVFDCTAVPSNLLESALFGHEKGAFTGAVSAHRGVFEEADGGTLLIDEIGDLDLALQPKLLRVLERSEIRRVGGSRSISVNVRVIAATRRNLDLEVQAGRFRDDLFFRLAVARVELPALRDRSGDVALLAEHFWRALGGDAGGFPYDALRRFEDYRWPGNVRELHNAVARLIALGHLARVEAGQPSSASALGRDAIDAVLELDLPLTEARDKLVAEFERRYVARVLDRHQGNVAEAAAASGIARRYFQILRARHRK